MDPNSTGWIQNRQQTCASDLALGGWNGCYLDAVGPELFVPGYLNSTPLDSATGQPWTDTSWVAATSSLSQQVQQEQMVMYVSLVRSHLAPPPSR